MLRYTLAIQEPQDLNHLIILDQHRPVSDIRMDILALTALTFKDITRPIPTARIMTISQQAGMSIFTLVLLVLVQEIILQKRIIMVVDALFTLVREEVSTTLIAMVIKHIFQKEDINKIHCCLERLVHKTVCLAFKGDGMGKKY